MFQIEVMHRLVIKGRKNMLTWWDQNLCNNNNVKRLLTLKTAIGSFMLNASTTVASCSGRAVYTLIPVADNHGKYFLTLWAHFNLHNSGKRNKWLNKFLLGLVVVMILQNMQTALKLWYQFISKDSKKHKLQTFLLYYWLLKSVFIYIIKRYRKYHLSLHFFGVHCWFVPDYWTRSSAA